MKGKNNVRLTLSKKMARDQTLPSGNADSRTPELTDVSVASTEKSALAPPAPIEPLVSLPQSPLAPAAELEVGPGIALDDKVVAAPSIEAPSTTIEVQPIDRGRVVPISTKIQLAVKAARTGLTLVAASGRTDDYITPDAARWLSNSEAIPGNGFAPVRYIGKSLLYELYQMLKHPVTLEEAQLLVVADGETCVCSSEGHEFQPVRYLCGISGKVEGQLRTGIILAKCDLRHIGVFYKNKGASNGKILVYSGSVFKPDALTEAAGSPLVIAMIAYSEAKKEAAIRNGLKPHLVPDRVRGETRDHIEGRTDRIKKEQGVMEYRQRQNRIFEQFRGAELENDVNQGRKGPEPLGRPFVGLKLRIAAPSHLASPVNEAQAKQPVKAAWDQA